MSDAEKSSGMENGEPSVRGIGKTRNNNLNFIQFAAALLVIYSHAFPIARGSNVGELLKDLTNSAHSFGNLAVAVFFIISGFLVSDSYERSQSFLRYMKARVLRIFPGLIGVISISVLVLGPCVTTLSPRDYFSSQQTWEYWKNLFLNPLYWELPGVFTRNLYSASVNGSLWTIPYQFGLYVGLGLLGMAGLLRYRKVNLALFILFCFLHLFPDNRLLAHDVRFLNLMVSDWLTLSMYFTAGMCAYAYRDSIRLTAYGALLAVGGILMSIFCGAGYFIATAVFGTYLILYVGYALRPVQLRLASLSYGIYIYGFPVQQLWTHIFGGSMNPYLNMLLSIPCVLILAWLSEILIEKPAMKLRDVTIIPENVRIAVQKVRGRWLNLVQRCVLLTQRTVIVSLIAMLVAGYALTIYTPSGFNFDNRRINDGRWMVRGWYEQDVNQSFRFVSNESELRISQPMGAEMLIIEGFLPDNFDDVRSVSVYMNGALRIDNMPLEHGQSFSIDVPLSSWSSLIPQELRVRLVFDAAHKPEPGNMDIRVLSGCITSIYVK